MVGPVIADDGGSWAKGLRGEGVEKAGKEWGAVAGSDKGDDGWGILHKSMMEVFRLGGSLIEEKSGKFFDKMLSCRNLSNIFYFQHVVKH